MERRFLTKALWAAAVVMMAIGALGQGVLAEKPPPPPECSATLACSDVGIILADVITTISAGEIDIIRDSLLGRACYSVLRAAAIVSDLVVDVNVSGDKLMISFDYGGQAGAPRDPGLAVSI